MEKIVKSRLKALLLPVACVLLLCAIFSGCTAAPAAQNAPVPAPVSEPVSEPVPTPEPTVDCGIPDLQYETEAYALDTLRSRGIVAVIEYNENDEVLPGLVESQSVEAGICVQSGQPVKLKIAKALPSPSPTPKPSSKPRKDNIDEETSELVPELTKAPVNVTYVDGVAVTPQPTWEPGVLPEPDPQAEKPSCG